MTGLTIFCIFTVLGDAYVADGGKAELVCSVNGLRNALGDCSWIAPNGTEYPSSGRRKSESGISVKANSRKDECILTIEVVSRLHSGFWECTVTEGRETAGKFGYLRTYVGDGSTPLQLLVDADATRVTSQRGTDVVLNCPSNNVARFAGQRPACRWLTPAGQTITLVG